MYPREESIIERVLKGDVNARVPERSFPPGAARRAQAINQIINKYGEALREKDEAALSLMKTRFQSSGTMKNSTS